MSLVSPSSSRARHSLLLVSASVLSLWACGEGDPPTPGSPVIGATSGPIGGGAEARRGADVDSVLGCLEGCVEMEQGILAMSNPKNLERHQSRLGEKKDQCFGMFELLDAAEREALLATALEPLRQCLGDRVPCLGQCTTLETNYSQLCSGPFAPEQCDGWVAELRSACPAALCRSGSDCDAGCVELGDAFVEVCMRDEATAHFCYFYQRYVIDTCAASCPPSCEDICQSAFDQSYSACRDIIPLDAGCFTGALEDNASCRYDCCVEDCPDCVDSCELAPVPVCGDGVCEGQEAEYCSADCSQACMRQCDLIAWEGQRRCWDAELGEWDWACLEEVDSARWLCEQGCARCGDGVCSYGEEVSCEQDCPEVCLGRCGAAEWTGLEVCRAAEVPEATCFEGVYQATATCQQACCDTTATPWCWVSPPPVCGDGLCDWREMEYCETDCPHICYERCRTREAEALAPCRAAAEPDPACFEAAYTASAACEQGCCEANGGSPEWPEPPNGEDPICQYTAPHCGDGVCDWRENEYCGTDCPAYCDQRCYDRFYRVDLPLCEAGGPDPTSPDPICFEEAQARLTQCLGGCAVCGDGYCGGGEDAQSCVGDCGYCGDGHCAESEAGWCWDCATECDRCVQRWSELYQWDFYACMDLGIESEGFDVCIHAVELTLLESCNAICCVEQCGPDGSGCPGVESCDVLPPPSECGNLMCELLEPNYCQVDCPDYF